MQQKIILVASILFAVLAFFLSKAYIKAQHDELYRGARKVEVLVARKQLPSGTKLDGESLTWDDRFETAIGENVFKKDPQNPEATAAMVNRIWDKELLRPLKRDEVLRWADVDVPTFTLGTFADVIDEFAELRAMSIPISAESAVAGLVRPTDRVDIIGTYVKPSDDPRAEGETITRLLLQDVTVLATGQEYATANAAERARWRRSGSYSSVTLEVTPREAEMLIFMQQSKGKLDLLLRRDPNPHFEPEFPRVNFADIEEQLRDLNEHRQRVLLKRGGSGLR